MSGRKTADWAPHDYTDGKPKGTWKSEYPPEARKGIRCETAYLVSISAICLITVLGIVYWCRILDTKGSAPNPLTPDPTCLAVVGALFTGTLGGCCFGLKCMYHFVAKLRWHEERRLWRLLSPLLSGVVALFMVLLVASGLLQIFDEKFIERPLRVIAFSFLVGLFSDKALAKMAEIADTLFGGKDNDETDQRNTNEASPPKH